MMKVLHIGKYYYPYKGGMESVLRSICTGLAKKGEDVTVLCFNDRLHSEILIDGKVTVHKAGIFGTLFSQPLSLSYVFLFFKLFFKSDVVHVHAPNPLATVLALFSMNWDKITITHHSDVYRQRFLKKLYLPVYNLLLARVSRIIVPTMNHIQYSHEIKNYKHKCEIIPFSLNNNFNPDNSALNQHLVEVNKKYPEPYFLFVGRLVEYKGLHVLMRAMPSVDGKLIIIGSGPERERLENQLERLKLRDKVKIIGRVESDEELLAYYKKCEVVVLPSISPNENFGMIQLEAMAFQKAVITTNLKSGVPCVGVHNETCLIVEPEDDQALSRAMNTLIKDKPLRERMGKAGFKRYQQNFTEEVAIASHIQTYQKISKAA